MNIKKFIIVTLITSIWINFSEVFRYFVIVRPKMKSELSALDEVAEMSSCTFAIWGVWDTILTALLVGSVILFGKTIKEPIKRALFSGGFIWSSFFVLFWVGMWNMQLASLSLALIALSLALIEMIVGAFIAGWLIDKK